MTNLIIVKLGGSVITHKESSPPRIDQKNLHRIATELTSHDGQLIVVIGGGAFGHQAAHKFGFGNPDTDSKQLLTGIPEIRHNMLILASRVEDELSNQGIPCVVISPFMFVTLSDNMIEHFPLEIIKQTMNSGITIIIHGDVCFDETKTAAILSGDTIAKYLAEQLHPKSVFIGTNVDGVMDDNPIENPNAKHIPLINNSNKDEVLAVTGPSSSMDVTGGMTKKITELLNLASQDMDIVIFNLLVPNRLVALIENESVICTKIQSN